LTVHDGKGQKDRTVPIPQISVPDLKRQLQKVVEVHEADLKAKYAGTFLPNQLERKYKNAAREFIWQWFFPAQSLTLIPETQLYKRYHIHETVVQKAIKIAVNAARIHKRARHIRSGIRLPAICCRLITISAPSMSCWGIAMSGQR
jgi:hypothetical protein